MAKVPSLELSLWVLWAVCTHYLNHSQEPWFIAPPSGILRQWSPTGGP